MNRRKAWDAACAAWSMDPCTDVIATVKLGERMMFAATDLICELGAQIEALTPPAGHDGREVISKHTRTK